eukprot:gene15102-20004_t
MSTPNPSLRVVSDQAALPAGTRVSQIRPALGATISGFRFDGKPISEEFRAVLRDLLPLWWRERPLFRGLACERVVCLSHHRDLYKQVALSWLRTPQLHLLDRATYPTAHAADSCLELAAHRQLAAAALARPLATDEFIPRLTHLTAHDGVPLVVCPVSADAVRRLPDSVLLPALVRWRTRSPAPIIFSGPPSANDALSRLAAALRAQAPGPVEVATHDTFPAFVTRLAT